MQNNSLALLLIAAGAAAFLLTRKSEEETPVPSTPAPRAEPLVFSSPVIPQVAQVQPLDPRLTPAESTSITVALSRETNPANLIAFAQSLEPDFPIAASLLRAKASILGGAR